MNSFTWSEVHGFFKEKGRVLAYDRIPFGLSDKVVSVSPGEDVYHPENSVERLFTLMDSFNIKKSILVGNSTGAAVAIQAALIHPERIEKLILLNPAVYTGENKKIPQWLMNTPQMRRLGQLMFRKMADSEALLKSSYSDSSQITQQRIDDTGIHRKAENWDRAYWKYVDANFLNSPDIISRFHEIKQPVLIIAGEDDHMFFEDSKRLIKEIPNGTLSVLPDCGHLPQEECPEKVIEAVSKWLAN